MVEEWRDISKYVGVYQASNLGRVRRIRRRYDSIRSDTSIEQILTPKPAGRGYWMVCLSWDRSKRYRYVHRLVAEAFIDNPEGLREVNHKNNDKADNRVENLEWMSSSDNHKHAAETGVAYRGSLNGAAKLTPDQVIMARQLNKDGVTRKALAQRFGVNYVTIADLVCRRTWAWL